MNICLFGGSFDPVHNGHVAMVNYAFQKKQLHKIIIIPAFRSPLKENAYSALPFQRFEMVKIAFQDIPNIEVSDFEIKKGGISYTIETIKHFKNELGNDANLYWLLGSDSVPSLPKWKNFSEIIELCRFIIIPRKGFPPSLVEDVKGFTPKQREFIKNSFLDVPTVDISSTEIRKFFSQNKEPVNLIPPKVLDYIKAKNLYFGGKAE